MRKVILLNAPPNAGKDTLAIELARLLNIKHLEFKGKLFELALCISGLSQDEWCELYTRELKEVKSDKLFGLSPREFLIDISERMVKPLCGKQYFGTILGLKARGGAVVSDSGFNEEAEALCAVVGAENVYCVRFTREGCTFNGDSRGYVDTPMIQNYLDMTNDGTIKDAVDRIINWLFLEVGC